MKKALTFAALKSSACNESWLVAATYLAYYESIENHIKQAQHLRVMTVRKLTGY